MLDGLPPGLTQTIRPETSSGGTLREDDVKIRDAARQFESLMVALLLKSMRGTDSGGWLGTGEDQTAASVMEMAEEQFAEALTAQGGLGLASLIVSGLKQKA